MTEKTKDAYLRAYRAFTEYLKWVEPLPSDWETCLVYFRGFLCKSNLASRTISSYISGVRNWLKLTGAELRENHYLMKQMHRASQRNDKERIRIPVTKHVLSQVMSRLSLVCSDLFEQRMFASVITLAYAGMFRIGELVESEHTIQAQSVLIGSDGETVHLLQHTSKTDQFRQKQRVVEVQADKTEFCPVQLLKLYSGERARATLYWKQKPVHFFVHKNASKVKKDEVLKVLRKCVKLIPGLDQLQFGTHSLRAGRVTDLHNEGFEDAEIMKKGGWTSACYKRYIKT